MQNATPRLRRLSAHQPQPVSLDGTWLSPPGRLLGWLRAIGRGLGLVLWTLVALPIQSVLVVLPGSAKARFARLYWRLACRTIGLHVRLVGRSAAQIGGRPVLFVANHSSWLDILVLGSRLPACFVSKDDIAGWPVIGTIARLGRTVFVSRHRQATGRERDDMRARLLAGDSLILFPEGTSSDGCRVLPFRSSFFAITEGENPPLVQPVSIGYDRLSGLPARRTTRPIFAWYGGMDLAPHFWRLAQYGGLRATLVLHAPIDPASIGSRKAVAQAAFAAVAAGAATLRQNRPV